MRRIAIVTDSTCDLPTELIDRLGVTVVSLNVHFGEEVFRDRIDLSADDFLDRLSRASDLPTTSQPAAGAFEAAFRQLATRHDAIVAVVISARLSGTIGSAMVAKDAVGDLAPIEIVDSQSTSLGLGFQVIRATELAAAGLDASEIATHLRDEVRRYHIAFFADTLEYLRRGGRIGKAQSLLGSMLSIKPLLLIDEGQVVPLERTRTRARAIRGLVDFARAVPKPTRIGVLHSTSPEAATALAQDLAALTPGREVIVARFGPVILTHLGPGALGVVVFEGGSD